MQFLTTTLLALATLGAASTDTAKTYFLKSEVKAGQSGKGRFNNLYLTAYHSGAGMNDAVLLPSKTNAALGQLTKTNSTPIDGHAFYNQIFTLGDYPYSLIPQPDEDFYAAWQPTVINAGNDINSASSGFWLNSTGLQWSSSPAYNGTGQFDGWLVCQWFRGVPQLFFNVAFEDHGVKTPSSCAKVNLVPEYSS